MGESNIIWIDLESTPGLLRWVIRDIQGIEQQLFQLFLH